MEHDNSGAQDAVQMVQAVQMASFLVGPILANPELVDSVRDQAAAALQDAGILSVRVDWIDPNKKPLNVGPYSLAEMFLSEMAKAFGFSIPGYSTLENPR